MSAGLRKKLNQQQQNYASAVLGALASVDMTHVDDSVRVVPCPVCGHILACRLHGRERAARAERTNKGTR